jgi:cytochrome bd-type quinol oxidase subunit 1
VLFTFIGFVGMYFLLGILFLFMFSETVSHGPEPKSTDGKALKGRSPY